MEVRLHDDIDPFAALARPLLDTDPVRHTLALTVLDDLRRTGDRPAVLVTLHEGPQVCGVALRSSGRGLLVSALPVRWAAPVDAVLADADPELAGACGPTEEVSAFSAAHVERTGATVETVMRLRLFVLVALCPPGGVRGAARRVGESDVDLVASWQRAFREEALGDRGAAGDPRESAQPVLRPGYELMLWVVDGVPVALAEAGPPVAGMSRVGPVYTPPEHRGRGYGSAVTAAASAWALAAGARNVVLFTDLVNPVSNAIYSRIGYRPVYDALELEFRSG